MNQTIKGDDSSSPPEIFSAEWAQAWGDALDTSEAYREAASSWEGALVLVMSADPNLGIPSERAVFLDLEHGRCHEARLANDEDRAEAPFVLAAEPAQWKRVLESDLDPLLALMSGKIRLARGSLAKLTPQVKAARELVRTAANLEASVPEGWSS
ncbi:MAG: SCP2 sterol-binding domain-containing protein [Acidobacteriota bacterium]